MRRAMSWRLWGRSMSCRREVGFIDLEFVVPLWISEGRILASYCSKSASAVVMI